jgi:uncharacterized RDD family membrane protein YckC
MAASGQMTQVPSAPRAPSLPIAGLGLRIVAFILDCIVVFGFVMLFFAAGFGQAALQGDDPPNWSIYVGLGVTASALFPFAPILFFVMWAWRSQSLGQMASASSSRRKTATGYLLGERLCGRSPGRWR